MRRALQSPPSVEKSEQFELLHQIVFEEEIHPLAIVRYFVTDLVGSVEVFETQTEGRTPLVN
jgi:hypothetical protein